MSSRMMGHGMESSRPSQGPFLVGRDRELTLITGAIERASGGRGGLILVCGEPGIGKSTLARAALERAQEFGLSTATGFAWEGGGAPAYWPWTQLFRSVLQKRAVPETITSQLGDLLPELESDSSAVSLRPEQARFRLMEAIRSLLGAVSAEHPMLLMLEDLHDADTDSLQLLQYVAPHLNELGILVIGTFRESEARLDSAREPLWRAARDAQMLQLDALTREEVSEYVMATTGTRPDRQQLNKLLSTSEGNPLFLVELVALSGDDSSLADDGWLPDTIFQAIQRQLDKMSVAVLDVLQSASVLGREFQLGELAALMEIGEAEITQQIELAITAQLVLPAGKGSYRFAHILHRDVLYHGLAIADRRILHARQAERTAAAIKDGASDRWSAYARHLALAGGKHQQVVDAWRKAAERARQRLAFSEAAASLAQALQAFGAGPDADPAERCKLLLELAEATLLIGEIDEGRAYAREAYGLARTLDDAALMADAALAYGSIFIVSVVDAELIQLLRDALERLPGSLKATRAKVMARLAAAMQPADDPGPPMEMAREALALARDCDDELVLFDTLRSAISAMMDFAPGGERALLNSEYIALARDLGNVPEEFRGNLRLTIDAAEIGDWQGLVNAIDACDRIATQIDLPHYRWRVASGRAMLATIRGDFVEASALIETAAELAAVAGDDMALVTVPVQKLSLCRDWVSDECLTFDKVQAMLEEAYRAFPGTEPFIQPFLAAALHERGESAVARAICGDEAMRRLLALDETGVLFGVGEIAIASDDEELAAEVYSRLIDRGHLCAHAGLMGTIWEGPVATLLGRLAYFLGNIAVVEQHLREAMAIAENMHSKPEIARIHHHLAEFHVATGDVETARQCQETAESIAKQLSLRLPQLQETVEITSGSQDSESLSMSLQGDFWQIAFRGETALIKNSKGLQILARLVDKPDTEFHVLDLASPSAGTVTPKEEAVSGIDEKARLEYRDRIAALQEDLDEAESMGDLGRTDTLRGELEFLTAELSRSFGLGGRARKSGTSAERARVNVQRRLRDAVKRIGEQLPDAGKYLENTIKTGSYCKYNTL